MSGTDDLRASDADRDRTAEIVRQAASEGRLDLVELEERLEHVFAAKTYGELAHLTRDLPGATVVEQPSKGGATPPGSGLARPGPSQLSAIFGEEKVTGTWLVPPYIKLRTVFGKVTLDFTDATIPQQVTIDAQAALGQVELIVPDDVAVVYEHGPAILGTRTNKTRTVAQPGTPILRVRSQVLLGEVVARAPKRRWFGR